MFSNLSAVACADLPEVPEKNKRKSPHVTSTWSTEDIYNLLSLIEGHPCLWEYSSVGYRDRHKRDLAWRDVAENCPGHDPVMTLPLHPTSIYINLYSASAMAMSTIL